MLAQGGGRTEGGGAGHAPAVPRTRVRERVAGRPLDVRAVGRRPGGAWVRPPVLRNPVMSNLLLLSACVHLNA